jgi:hypothetical protein
MTRDPASQAVHERLEHAVSSMPAFDVDAGWAALAAQLEPPVAPVIPLRRHRPRRVLALAVAAAVFVGGSALAMVRHGGVPSISIAPVATLPGSGLVVGPHVHGAFSGAPPAPPGHVEGNGGGGGGGGGQEPSGTGSPGGDSGGSTPSGGSGDQGGSGGSGAPNQDSPDDTDHGSGNDGQHDDNGQGNDAQGQDSQGSGNGGGQGGGNGGSQGGNSGARSGGHSDHGNDHAAHGQSGH